MAQAAQVQGRLPVALRAARPRSVIGHRRRGLVRGEGAGAVGEAEMVGRRLGAELLERGARKIPGKGLQSVGAGHARPLRS